MSGLVRWGFLGAGFIASKAMAPALREVAGASLQVVGARDLARAEALEPVRATTSYAEVCEADDVDAVYISLPNDAHLEWVVRALEAGKHVLCEKPLAMNAAEVAQIQAAADRTGLLAVEAAWNRWHPRTRRAEELALEMSGPRSMAAWFTFPGVPTDNYRLEARRGGGALLDVGTYAVAAAHWALDADVFDVDVASANVGSTGVDLTTTAVLSCGAGRAEVRSSFEQPESQGLRVESGDRVIDLGSQAFTSWRAPSELLVVEGGVGGVGGVGGIERVETFEACDAYQLMLEAMSARVRGDDAWLLPLSTSWQVAATLDAIAAFATSN